MPEEDLDFLRRISSIVHRASGELSPRFFSIDEASQLNGEAAKLWRSAGWLRLVLDEMSSSLKALDHPAQRDLINLQNALLDAIEAAYLIGADTNYGKSQQRFAGYQSTAKMRSKKKDALTEEDHQARLEALRFAQSQPPAKPLGKAKGTTALAGRLLPQFNAHLKKTGREAVSRGVVEKMLRKYPPV